MEKITKRCRICGDRARSFNYSGQISCPSCRVFFHRNATKVNSLRCLKDGNCEIDHVTRSCCAACRMKKCLAIGMDLASIRFNVKKNKIRKKSSAESTSELTLEALLNDTSNLPESPPPPPLKTPPRPRTKPLISYTLNTAEREVMAEIDRASGVFEEENSLQVAGEASGILYISRLVTAYSRRTVRYCKSIQVFKDLGQEDQLKQLKPFCYDLLVIRGAFQYDRVNDVFTMLESDTSNQTVIVKRSSYTFENWHLIEENRQIFSELNIEMENDTTIRNLLTAISLMKPIADYDCPETVRYQFYVYCYLLCRYLTCKHRNARKAEGQYLRLMRLMQRDFSHMKENIRTILREFGVNQVADLIVETLNLKD